MNTASFLVPAGESQPAMTSGTRPGRWGALSQRSLLLHWLALEAGSLVLNLMLDILASRPPASAPDRPTTKKECGIRAPGNQHDGPISQGPVAGRVQHARCERLRRLATRVGMRCSAVRSSRLVQAGPQAEFSTRSCPHALSNARGRYTPGSIGLHDCWRLQWIRKKW